MFEECYYYGFMVSVCIGKIFSLFNKFVFCDNSVIEKLVRIFVILRVLEFYCLGCKNEVCREWCYFINVLLDL